MPDSVPVPPSERRFRAILGTLSHPWATWVLGGALSILAAVQALHRAQQGRVALLKWEPDFVAFWSESALYGRGAEGYPTLPLSLLVMSPFRALGAIPGACAWALFKIGLAWWIVSRAFRLCTFQKGADAQGSLSALAQLVVLAFAFRPLLSDVTHGNLNILVGATIATSAWAWHRGQDVRAGLWLGLGAVLKVTPALGLLFFLWKRNAKGLLGMGAGLALGLLLPAFWVGLERNLELDLAWWKQMIVPYLSGREMTLLQTEHINQSLLGVLARWLTDSVAIPAATTGAADISIHIAALSPQSFRFVHVGAILATLGILLASLAPRRERRGPWVLAEYSQLALVMLFLSERSWKHHYVLIAFPLAYLVSQVQRTDDPRSRRFAVIGLLIAAVLIGGTGSAFLGHAGSNLAEAYGSFLAGGYALFLAIGWIMRRKRKASESLLARSGNSDALSSS